jgi:phytoene desaturase
MRHVFAELFASAGRNLEDYLDLRPLDPLTRYFFPDGVQLDVSRDLSLMNEQISRLDPRDLEGYLAYLAQAARLHRITGPVFVYDQPPTWRSFLGVPLRDMLQVEAWRTMDRSIARYVHSPHLRQLLGRFATYVGASPFQAPATLNVIAHVELTGGVYYPRGGVYQIAAAMRRLAEELGVEIRLNCPVSEIIVQNGRAQAVRLADGEVVPGTAVLANVDVATVYDKLLPKGVVGDGRRRQRTQYDPSCSGFILMLGVEKQHPQLAHHNIFFSRDYRREFNQIFQQAIPPDDPTIYLAITSKSDPDHAPPGGENWFILVNAPPLGNAPQPGGFDWQKEAAAYRDLVLGRMAEWGYDVRGQIAVERMLTPLDLQRLTGAWRGALYGVSSNNPWTAFRRPHNRCEDVAGLYFAGGTTHPGGGVPMVALSGKVAAEMILGEGGGNL